MLVSIYLRNGSVRGVFALLAGILALYSGGCAESPIRNPVPLSSLDMAIIPGVPNAKIWADGWTFSEEFFDDASTAELRKKYPEVYGQSHSYLAISGGGSDGAFGAGLLAGWSKHGDRPEFSVVTGISTGALTAPFAFLGENYDDTLKELYTTTNTEEIVAKKNLFHAPFSDSIGDSILLEAMLQKYLTDEIVDLIAKEHAAGRRLFVVTFNLDAGRSVIWNIGAIAASEHKGKVDLVHEILLASASIPVLLPPVLIQVESEGHIYEELHVDGGTGTQVFSYPASVDWKRRFKRLNIEGTPQVFVIRNGYVTAKYEPVDPNILSIASRSISSLIRTQGVGDIYQIYTLCKRDGQDFNLASIPPEFSEEATEVFDPVYMGKLFQLGFDLAAKGYEWSKEPPGYSIMTDD